MLIVRLKQFEAAMADGRLDEAFDLGRAADVRSHRRGQELVGQLCRKLARRGQTHLAEEQFDAAARDCEKAAHLGGNLPEVVQLRAAVSEAMAGKRLAEQRCAHAAAAVRRHIDQGQLSVGEQLIATAPLPADKAAALKSELAARRSAVKSAIDKATAALRAGDWEGAADHLARLSRGNGCDPAVREAAARVNQMVVAQATEAIESGRLDLAVSLMHRHEKLPGRWADADLLRQTLRQCGQALERIAAADPAGAQQIIRTLAPLWPRAKWIGNIERQLQQSREAIEELRTGPLRLATLSSQAQTLAHSLPKDSPAIPKSNPTADLLLHVDGAGGFRLIGRPVVRIGSGHSSAPPDVALLADASLPAITLRRVDEDYFLETTDPVNVNDKPTRRKLLSSGDQIALGSRCRIRFRRPSPASATVVLDISGARLSRGDVRQVILMDRELVIGPGPAAHIRVDDLNGPSVLQNRGGLVVSRAAHPVQVDGRDAAVPVELEPGVPVTIGPVGIAVAKEQ